MKLIYSLLIIICFNSNNIAQCTLANDLDSPDWGHRINTLDTLAKYGMTECLPEIHQRIFNQPSMILRYFFLRALAELNDPDIEYWALAFIDSAENFEDPLESANALRYKVDATKILFDFENYSTAQLVFDLLNEDPDRVDVTVLVFLNEIILHVPAYADEAESELVRILNNYNIDNSTRFDAFAFLVKRNYSNIIDECVNAVLSDPSSTIRHAANGVLRGRNYSVHDLYLQQISIESDPVIRSKYATSLLHLFGEPADLKTVIDFHPTETDTTMLWFVGYEVDNFIPPKPDTLNWNELATRLISYTDEMYGYEWILNEGVRDYYIDMLLNVISILEGSEGVGILEAACSILNERILSQAEQDLQEELITNEGYKFLHYYTIYIKEEIEEVLGPCP